MYGRKKTDTRSFNISGIVEAFYGRLWTMEERKRLVQTFAPKGLNHYLYAPKEDSKVYLNTQNAPPPQKKGQIQGNVGTISLIHENNVYSNQMQLRSRWRMPYTEDELGVLQDFSRFCSSQEVSLNVGKAFYICFNSTFLLHNKIHCHPFALSLGVSPGLDFSFYGKDYSSDLEALAHKFASYVLLGCRHLTLLMDEIPHQMFAAEGSEQGHQQAQKKAKKQSLATVQSNLANSLTKVDSYQSTDCCSNNNMYIVVIISKVYCFVVTSLTVLS